MAQKDSETVFSGDDTNDESQNEQVLDLDDITGSDMVTVDKGEKIEMVVAEVRKNYSGKYELSEVDYNIHIVDTEGDVFPINAWVLWNKVRAAFREAQEQDLIEDPSGLALRIKRGDEDGDYEVFWKTPELEDWQQIELDG
jgi:hypothetical protein